MWPALILRQLQQCGNPGIPSEACRIVDGQSKIVADFGAGNPFRFVLVKPVFPFAARIGLGEHGTTQQPHKQQRKPEYLEPIYASHATLLRAQRNAAHHNGGR
jgi:hypothetical protein